MRRTEFWKQGMTKQGRGNPQSNIVPFNRGRSRIRPLSDLTIEELRIFDEVVRRHAPTHFTESDRPLLNAYCTAVHLSRLYNEHGRNGVARRMRLKTQNLIALLANRLRLNSS